MKLVKYFMLGFFMFLASCGSKKEDDPVVAIVNGDKVYKSNLIAFLPHHARHQDITPYFEQLRDRAINTEIILQKAVKEIKPDDPELQDEIEQVKKNLIFNKYKQEIINKVSDEKALKSYYEKFIKENPSKKEVRARHILVESEEEANQILKALESGTPFEELSETKSKDRAANAQKGDLGYFRAEDMVKPFSEKAFSLANQMSKNLGKDEFKESKGEKGIVQTQFGWHVIEILGQRASSHPPFQEMKDQLQNEAFKEEVEKRAENLRKNAKVEILPLPPVSENKEDNPILVRIDGEDFTKSDLLELVPNFNTDIDIAPFYEKLSNEFVKKELITREALKTISASDKEIQKELNQVKRRILVNLYLERRVKSKISDESLQKSYKEYLAKTPETEEVNARHILVDSEDEAKAILEKVKTGVDFAALANEKSKDKAAKDGNLGYFHFEDMVPEFSKLAFSLKPPKDNQKGETGLVKTSFGWHVVEVLDRRKSPQPSFEEIKETLEAQESQKIVDDIVAELKKTAKIELFDLPKQKEKDAKEEKDKKEQKKETPIPPHVLNDQTPPQTVNDQTTHKQK